MSTQLQEAAGTAARAVQGVARGGLRRLAPLLVLAAAVVAVTLLLHAARGQEATPSPVPAATPAPSAGNPYAPGYGPVPTPSATPTPDDQKPEALLAQQFLGQYLDASGGKEAWLARLQPLAAGDLYDGLALADWGRVPHGKAGKVRTVTPSRTGDATVVVASTTGDFRLYVARVNGGAWQVNNIEPAGRPA